MSEEGNNHEKLGRDGSLFGEGSESDGPICTQHGMETVGLHTIWSGGGMEKTGRSASPHNTPRPLFRQVIAFA